MKHSIKVIAFLLAAVLISACEREFDSEGLAVGVIRYPAITLNDGVSTVIVAGSGEYEEPGAVATMGTDDISGQLQIEGADAIDTSTPGVYPVNYTVAVENEIGQETVVTETRYVIVTTEDVTGVDLSGNYIGYGFAANPLTMPVTKLGDGWYSIPDVLSSGNGIFATFAHLGGDVIMIPPQIGGFGEVNTTAPGASATLTEEGFTWTVYIDCCGLFGPVEFERQ